MSINLTGAANCRVDVAQYYNGTTFDVPSNTGAMTICAWIKATSLGAAQRVFVKSLLNCGANSTLYGISITEICEVKRLRVYLTTGTSDTILDGSTTTIATGTVYFICLWYDGSNFRSYINAVQEATVAKTGNVAINSAMPLYIGDNPNVRLNFNGIIDDVRVYTRALTVNEMKTIYYGAGRDNIVNGLYANWKLREKHFGSRFSLPNTLIDYSSFKKHAISEDAGYALSFDGVNDVVGLACVNTDFQLVAPFTIEAWVKPMFNYACWAASTAYSVGDKRVYSGIPYRCTLNHTSQVGWEPPNAPALWALEEAFLFGTNYLDGNGVSFGRKGRKLALLVNGQRWYESTGDLTSGTWSHVSVVFQDYCCGGKQSLFYINGCLIDTVCDAYAANPGITLNLAQIGARGDSACYWYGSIDQVKMYKGEARSAANISLYKDEHPPNNSNLKGYWKLNDASGTSAADVSGNSHTGTISGAVWEESSAWAIPLCDNILSHRRT